MYIKNKKLRKLIRFVLTPPVIAWVALALALEWLGKKLINASARMLGEQCITIDINT